MGIKLGLDIGTSSVGVAVIDDDYNVIEAVSDIFTEADASKNVERRGFRQTKRLIRRRQNRISDFKGLWEKYNLEIPKEKINNQLILKNKGLNEKLTQNEIYYVLLHSLKHRGITYLDDAIDETSKSKSDYQKGIEINQNELKNKFPCQIQLERLNTLGKYRGETIVKENDETITFSNIFTKSSYRKENEEFLNKQSEFHDFITKAFIDDYLTIFDRKREYYVGPGNEKSRTDYGRYTTKKDENGNYITEENIFEKLIGKCSVYENERRAAGASYTAQEFNILNDLNNITIGNRKLTKEEKIEIINTVKTSKTVNMLKIIAKVTNEDIKTMFGSREDKNGKPDFHKFEQYNKLRRTLEEHDIDINDFSIETLDKLAEILTINTEKDGILNAIKNSNLNFSDELIEILIAFRKKNSSLFSKWQSLSLKIMKELIPQMYEEPKNQMELLTEMGFFKKNSEKFKEYNKIPKEEITKEIYNPVVKKSISITIDAINAVIKKYGYPDEIVIEMPRDRNSEEEKKNIQKMQKANENEMKKIKERLFKEYNIDLQDKHFHNHKNLALKLKLWNEQDGRCMYSGEYINIEDLIYDYSKFEIDHIIPKSISFDDSRSNKVLVYRRENQLKGNTTPYMYLKDIDRKWNFDEFMSYALDLKDRNLINKNKLKNLLFTEDITKIEVLKGFIQRNINDTRYASRVVLNSLQNYFKSKNKDTKISVIRGSFTHQMRDKLKLKKDRDESYSHHAVDAMLICYSKMGYNAYHKFQENFIDFEHNEIKDKMQWIAGIKDEKLDDIMYEKKWNIIRNNILKAEKEVKFWHKVDKKANRGLCNQTIRGTRNYDEKTYKINKINILTDDGFKTFKTKIQKGKESDFLMYRNDKKTFDILLKIFNEYKDCKNPFVEYEKETGDYIRKYSKKGNGARIQILKYLDGEVGSCIDVSHKYGHKKGSKKVILESLNPYRTDVYYNEEKKEYYLIGVKYADCRCIDGKYFIDKEKYNIALRNEKIIKENQSMEDLKALGWKYKFSLYKNDFIEYEKDGEIFTERFLSRTMPRKKNYIETKPTFAPKFDKPQKQIGLSKTKMIKKIRVDILGNRYYAKDEDFTLDIDIY
ncbi:type II CRISPR RNA-guided endonuclease Cas9 [Anaerofustis stercorihominis]|uniref:type II CRISPR RNA-guided endonuclease Cas9 n=1 Tax=Anaerofustis stercorihominis TaxID=214853 RepID=UPI00110639F5|nr:type II CRISPR RNA-guided endonuclease Cas9 [Anaerofustis stercorihominis]